MLDLGCNVLRGFQFPEATFWHRQQRATEQLWRLGSVHGRVEGLRHTA